MATPAASYSSPRWDAWVKMVEARNSESVAVIDVTSSPARGGTVVVRVVRDESDSSSEQFGVIRKETDLGEFRALKRVKRRDEPLPSIALESGTWVLDSDDCTMYVLTGTPIDRTLKGVIVKAVTSRSFTEGTVWKAFTADNARILSRGPSKVVMLVTDRTDVRRSTWDMVVIKIQIRPKVVDLDAMGGVIVPMLLNKVFYESRVTPSVTRSFAVWQCSSSPPDTGASMESHPFATAALFISTASVGSVVVISMSSAPGRRPSNIPLCPK